MQCDADEASDSATVDIERGTSRLGMMQHRRIERTARRCGDCKDVDQARERIQEGRIRRSGARRLAQPGDCTRRLPEFFILLCTGGPAVRIMGEIDDGLQPSRAWIEYQDWGTPWTEYHGAQTPRRSDLLQLLILRSVSA